MEETGEAYAGGAVVVTPRLVIAVYAAGVVRKGQSACGVVERIEIIVRVYGDSGHCLHGVFKPEAVAEEQVGDMPDHRARQRMSVCAEIGHGRVAVEDFAIERQSGGRAYAESRVYADTDRALFPAHERAAGHNVVKRGYDFDITGSTINDQKFIKGRSTFENVDKLVDEMFNTYIRRQGFVEPLAAKFCNGTTVTCDGLSQWGSERLARQGSSTLDILRLLGCRADRDGPTVTVDATALCRCNIPEHLMREMRSSVIFLGALLSRMGETELSYPGGCELGPRPIDLHLSALRSLGAEILEEQGCLCCRSRPGGSQEICLPFPSVGATENVMLAACGCPGLTTIIGAAREPEIVDLQRFLQGMGAQVEGAGSSILSIQGGLPLHPACCRVMGDRIEAATYLCAAAAARGEVELTGIAPQTLTAVLACLEEAGCGIHTGPDRVALTSRAPLRGCRQVRTAPYPGFPTDAQAVLMAALLRSRGATVFVENMFENRYRHVDELRRMGADISVADRVAVVTGVPRLCGASVRATDLRGGAALLVAGLAAEGVTRIGDIHHIQRGYEDPVRDLGLLGARITLEEE